MKLIDADETRIAVTKATTYGDALGAVKNQPIIEDVVPISREDFGTLCICALRYCHGRRTYMPSLVQRIVMGCFDNLSDKTLKVIADDEQFQSDMNLFGDHCDLVDWKNFYQILREYMQTERSE